MQLNEFLKGGQGQIVQSAEKETQIEQPKSSYLSRVIGGFKQTGQDIVENIQRPQKNC